MSKTIKQYRYYGDNNAKNYPSTLKKDSMDVAGKSNPFISDSIIQDIGMITHLGIQGMPGTKIRVNQGSSPIIIGGTGLFELDLTDYSYIYSLQIDYQSSVNIETAQNGYLIIDAIYDTEV